MKSDSSNGAAVNQPELVVPTLPAGQASVEQLMDRVQATIRIDNQTAAIRSEAIAELRRREGTTLTEATLRSEGLLARRRARAEIETATQLSELPKTSEGLRKGEISYDNARIIAGAAKRGKVNEEELADLAKSQAPDKFAGTVRRHEQAQSEDDGVSKLQHQRERRFASIKTDIDDGMTVLYGRFDPITGAGIEAAVSHVMTQLWHAEDSTHRTTPEQRMADALALMLTENDAESRSSQGVRLLLMADYHTLSGQVGNPRLADGTPIPAGELRRLACDAQILPAIFSGASQPLDLGRSRRVASSAQRIALIARDKRCIGCGAKAAWCQAHHIIHWQNGGPTNLDNLCLLCSRCHHKVHDEGWTVERSVEGRYSLRRPLGRHRKRPSPRPTYSTNRRRRVMITPRK